MNFFIKKLFLPLALLVCSTQVFASGIFYADIPEREICATQKEGDPFALNVFLDSGIAILGAGLFTTAFILDKADILPAYDSSVVYDKNSVNAFDRWAMRPYSKGIDFTGDILLATCAGVFPALTFGLEAAFANLPLMSLLKIGVMYAEAYILDLGIKDILKIAINRERPYMYFDSKSEDALSGNDWQYSCPSGHTTSAFMSAGFLSYVFCTYYPDSAWKGAVIGCSFGLATTVGAFRMLSGNHFFSDVLFGAVLGTACGIGVPFLHNLVAKSKSRQNKNSSARLENLALLPAGFSVSVSFK